MTGEDELTQAAPTALAPAHMAWGLDPHIEDITKYQPSEPDGFWRDQFIWIGLSTLVGALIVVVVVLLAIRFPAAPPLTTLPANFSPVPTTAQPGLHDLMVAGQ